MISDCKTGFMKRVPFYLIKIAGVPLVMTEAVFARRSVRGELSIYFYLMDFAWRLSSRAL
jgi:hypothetical protein